MLRYECIWYIIAIHSEDYPYKEVLDKLAKRCLSYMTNAWTAQDHTCYMAGTAGPDGFANLLPVFLDHIFFPTLRDQDFLTEIHHIDGEGKDAGTVYSEMTVSSN